MAHPDEHATKRPELQLVVFRVREEEFGLEISTVLEISRWLPITHLPEAPGGIDGVVNLRGRVIPVVDMAKQFGLAPHVTRCPTARIVVVEAGEDTMGLLVDEVPEVLRISEQDVEPTPELMQGEAKDAAVNRIAKLGTRLIMILDLERLLGVRVREAAER